jgi:hypothetical protein
MATYKGINGFAVQSVATDPSPLNEGQVWYNNVSYAFKLATFSSASWASGGNLSTARDIVAGAGATASAALAIGGYPPAGGGIGTTAVESYNGTSWTGAPNLATGAYDMTSTGTQTSAIGVGGYSGGVLSANQLYNGSSWTNSPVSYPQGLSSSTACGTQTAAMVQGNNGPNSFNVNNWNGSSWTGGTAMPPSVGVQYAGSAGTQTASLHFGGAGGGAPPTPGTTTFSTSWNGASWTTTPSLNTTKYTSGSGTQTAALAPGGYNAVGPGYTLVAEVWNGSSWTNSATNPVTHGYQINQNRASNTPGASGLIFGGGNYPAPGNTVSTELFTGAAITTKTITTS